MQKLCDCCCLCPWYRDGACMLGSRWVICVKSVSFCESAFPFVINVLESFYRHMSFGESCKIS